MSPSNFICISFMCFSLLTCRAPSATSMLISSEGRGQSEAPHRYLALSRALTRTAGRSQVMRCCVFCTMWMLFFFKEVVPFHLYDWILAFVVAKVVLEANKRNLNVHEAIDEQSLDKLLQSDWVIFTIFYLLLFSTSFMDFDPMPEILVEGLSWLGKSRDWQVTTHASTSSGTLSTTIRIVSLNPRINSRKCEHHVMSRTWTHVGSFHNKEPNQLSYA